MQKRVFSTPLNGHRSTGKRLSQTLPGLANFYMVGQWAGLPGVSTVAAMGRDVARAICRQDGKRFLTHAPAQND